MVIQYKPASLSPDDMAEGGGLPSGNQLVQKSRFGLFTYPNGQTRSFGLLWTLVDEDNVANVQFYSGGKESEWSPSAESSPGAGDEGRYAIPMAGEQALSKSSNVGFLMSELVSAGFPKDRISADALVFENLFANFVAKAQPKRDGLTPAPEGRQRQSSIPTIIHNLPWEPSKRGQVVIVGPGAIIPPDSAIATIPSATGPALAPAATSPAPAPATPANNGPAAAPAVGPVQAANPPAAGAPDVATLNRVCLDAMNAALNTLNPTPKGTALGQIFNQHGADPNVNAYTNHAVTAEFVQYAAQNGVTITDQQVSRA